MLLESVVAGRNDGPKPIRLMQTLLHLGEQCVRKISGTL